MVMGGEIIERKEKLHAKGGIAEMFSNLDDMLNDLRDNWTRVAGGDETEGHDRKSQQEKLQRIWAILYSDI